jgi:hypothetical protein
MRFGKWRKERSEGEQRELTEEEKSLAISFEA